MPDDGQPIPVDCTLIGAPSNVPVKPSIPRSSLTRRAPGSKNVSAMYFAPARVARAQDAGGVVALGGAEVDRHETYFKNLLVVLSARILPPVWHVGQ